MPKATNQSSGFSLPEPGPHKARCVKIIDLGTQTSDYQGKQIIAHKVMLVWELPESMNSGDETKPPVPFLVNKEYTVSTNEKANLRKDVESWLGRTLSPEEVKELDIDKLLNRPCQLNLIHKPSTKNPAKMNVKIVSISPLMKGVEIQKAVTPLLLFNIGAADEMEVIEKLSDYEKGKVRTCKEFADRGFVMPATAPAEADHDDDPFT